VNSYEFVIALVFVVGLMSILRARAGVRHRWERPAAEEDSQETLRLREEVKELKERIKVLERITVDKENSLSRQIEELRDR
jgi:hypothetical protein